jgi:transcriptional regulator NrdR family protein
MPREAASEREAEMIYPCPKCGKRTKVPRSPRQKEGDLLRKRKCMDPTCGNEFATIEITREANDAIVLRRFNKQFGAALAELRILISVISAR